jgi:hypothetical protein
MVSIKTFLGSFVAVVDVLFLFGVLGLNSRPCAC